MPKWILGKQRGQSKTGKLGQCTSVKLRVSRATQHRVATGSFASLHFAQDNATPFSYGILRFAQDDVSRATRRGTNHGQRNTV
jgi:hypothetical protein